MVQKLRHKTLRDLGQRVTVCFNKADVDNLLTELVEFISVSTSTPTPTSISAPSLDPDSALDPDP